MSSDNMTSPPSTTLPRSTLPAQVASALLGSIVSGELAAGSQIPTEAEIGARFGVSRTVVREAVRTIAEKGLVEVRPGRGMWVRPSEEWDPLDAEVMRLRFDRGEFGETWRQFTEARAVFEVETAALAARRRTQADIESLRSTLRLMRERAADAEAFRRADIDFHVALARATQNAVLLRILEPVHNLFRSGGLRSPTAYKVEPALQRHEDVLVAVAAGDEPAARAAMVALFDSASHPSPQAAGGGAERAPRSGDITRGQE